MVRIGFFSCVLLIALRLAIGWHVTYEGLNKYESTKRGKTETSKPFSSLGYFTEAEGPLGPTIRDWLGDADLIALAKLRLKDPVDNKPQTRIPEALEKDWNEYARQLEVFYKLSDDQKKDVANKLERAKIDFVLWRTDTGPQPKDSGKTFDESRRISFVSIRQTIIYRPENKVEQRCIDYEMMVREIRHALEVELPKMGRDVEKIRLRELKNKTAEVRADLMKDVDQHTLKMREALAKVVGTQINGVDFRVPEGSQIDERVLAMLELKDGTGMPALLDQQWNEYVGFVKDKGQEKLRNDPQRADEMLTDAKTRYVRFLRDQDQYTGAALDDKDVSKRLESYRAAFARLREAREKASVFDFDSILAIVAAAKVAAPYRLAFMDDVRRHTEILRQNLGGFATDKDLNRRLDPAPYVDETLPFDNYQGTIRPEKEKTRFLWLDWPTTKLEWMDWSTRWGLLIAGLCILFGLFTRLACLGVAVFLLVEILSNTPLPWLPTSPKSEGSYAFVNKNTVEMIGLLVLATLPTGRWFGLDALLSCIWPFRRRTKPAVA